MWKMLPKGGDGVKRILKPISLLLVVLMVYCIVGVDAAVAQQGKVMMAQDAGGDKELPLVLSLLIVGAIVYGLSQSAKKNEARRLEQIDVYFESNPGRIEFKQYILDGQVAIVFPKLQILCIELVQVVAVKPTQLIKYGQGRLGSPGFPLLNCCIRFVAKFFSQVVL